MTKHTTRIDRNAVAKILKALSVNITLDTAIADFQDYNRRLLSFRNPRYIYSQPQQHNVGLHPQRPDIVAALMVDSENNNEIVLIHGDILAAEGGLYAIRPHRGERLNEKPPFKNLVILRRSKVFCIRKQSTHN